MNAPMRGTVEALRRAAPDWPEGLAETVAQAADVMRVPDGATVFGPGDPVERFVVVLSGAVRVEQFGEGGRSIVLYRVGAGDSCVMTTSCLLSGAPYGAFGTAEGETEVLALPARTFRRLVEEDPRFRALTLSVFSERIRELTEVIEDLLVRRVDLRLAAWLHARSAATPRLSVTHQAIAGELGTAREVVSRILKDFERRGWIALSRGAVEVLDRGALARMAGDHAA
jgi:CRP/FNR family transcriptional regulator